MRWRLIPWWESGVSDVAVGAAAVTFGWGERHGFSSALIDNTVVISTNTSACDRRQ